MRSRGSFAALLLALGACTSTTPGADGSPSANPPLLGGAPPTTSCPVTPDWKAAPAVTTPAPVSYFHAVTGSAADDVWGGGYEVTPNGDQVLLARYQAAVWIQEPTRTAGKINGLTTEGGASWAVGQSGDGTFLTMRRTGRAWGQVLTPRVRGAGEARLDGVAFVSGKPTAVGSADTDDATITQVLTWNGSRWIASAAPATGTTGRLTAIASLGDQAWAVGRAESGDSPKALIMHNDGKTWSPETLPALGTFSELEAVTAIATDDVYAVGTMWDAQGAHSLILHYDGKAWTKITHPEAGISGQRGGPAPPYGPALNAVWGTGPDDVWAAGLKTLQKDSAELVERFLVLQWDGKSWTEIEIPRASDETSVMTAGISFSASDVFLAGYAFTATSDDVTATLISRACL